MITGASGYIGRALARRLAATGRPLRLVSRGKPEIAELAGHRDRLQYMAADLRDKSAWRQILSEAESVVHLSSRTDLRAAEADPEADAIINIEPVRALVEAATALGRKDLPIIFASTVTIVGAEHENPVDETTPDRPCSVYDRHKLACESILRNATSAGYLRACSLRLSNVYGYGSASVNSNRGILNLMLATAARGQPLSLYGDGRYIRDFTHVDDVVEAFVLALSLRAAQDGRAYVIATGRGHSLAETFAMVAEEAARCGGPHVAVRRIPEPADLHPIERRNFVGNSNLFRQLTGWRPRVGLMGGIRDFFDRSAGWQSLSVTGRHSKPLD